MKLVRALPIVVTSLVACTNGAPLGSDTSAGDARDTSAGDTSDTSVADTSDTSDAGVGDTSDAGVGDTSDAGVGDERDARSYCELTVDVFCPYYLRCGRIVASDLDECRATFLETCNARYEPLYAALADRGLLSLSAAGIARCRAHLEAVACEAQIFDLDGGCDAVWVGQVGGGGGCGPGLESFVCDGASTCVLGLDFCGQCKPIATGACDVEHRCPDDGTCKDGGCVARAQVGERCDGGTTCVLGASCDGGRCAAPTIVAVGDLCDQTHRCPYRASCSGRCVKAALLGEACDASVTCASGWCSGGICVPLLGAGASCSASASCVSGRCSGGSCLAPGASACLP